MPGDKPRVVYWQNIPSPYVVERYNALADRGNLDFEAWFNEEREPDRSWEVNLATWRFKARYIPKRPLFRRKLHLPLFELAQVRPDVLISLYDRACFAFGSLAACGNASRRAYRVLPNYDSWSEYTWWKEVGKHFLFRSIDGAKVPGPDGAHLALRYALPRSRIRYVTQSINIAHYTQARQASSLERTARRHELGLHGCVFIYVGRLWSGKGVDYLLDAFRTVWMQQQDVSLLLLGDGVDEARYRLLVRDLPNVVFAGFVQPRDIPHHYALADVMIFPTLGDPHGLVVDEAMAAGVPVICTESAGDIRRRLPDGEAGFIVPPADAAVLADRMLRLAVDPVLRARFVARGEELVAAKQHECWAKDVEAFVCHLLAMPPRHTLAARLARGIGRYVQTAGTRDGGVAAPLVSDPASIISY